MVAVVFMLVITLLVVEGFVTPLIREYHNADRIVKSNAAYFLSEAGIEDVFYRLKNGMSVSPTETLELDGSTATATVTFISGSEKEILSASNVNNHYRKLQMSVSSSLTDIELGYAAQIGTGGITLGNNAEVRGEGGGDTDVYANGPVIGAANAIVRGNVTVSSSQFQDSNASSSACDTDVRAGKNPNNDVAQSFMPTDTETLARVSLYLKRNGQPNNKTVRIVADNAGVPDTTTLASATLNKNMGGTTYGWVDITFASPTIVTSGQKYWIVIDGSSHNSKYWFWCGDSSAGYGDGAARYTSDFSSGPWTGISEDLAFKLYLGEGQSLLQDMEVTLDAKADTIIDSFVWGDAYYETISGTTVLGSTYPDSPTPPEIPMPITQSMIDGWKADAAAGTVISGNCPGTGGCGAVMGPAKIDGDLFVENNETVTLTGILYVTGDVEVNNNATIRCDPTFDANSCILLVDGTILPYNNAYFNGSGTTGSYVLAVSTVTGCIGGTQQGHCLSGNSAINLSNNVWGGLFYSTDGRIYMDNNVDIVSAVGYMLYIENNGAITYETAADDLTVSSGSDSGWFVNDWREVQ